MLLPRKESLTCTSLFLALLLVTSSAQSNSRSYDTNDWIPVSRPTSQTDENQEVVQKRPTGRVLNLHSIDDKRFYAADQGGGSLPPSYRVTVSNQHAPKDTRNKRPNLLHYPQGQRQFPIQPNKYKPQQEFLPTPQQQILLPPQLQSIINQAPSYITPHRINSQLLQEPDSYQQPTIQTIPTQGFPLNATDYNLGLYSPQPSSIPIRQNQQSIKQQPDNNEPQEIQLLYVPLENLQRQRGQRQQLTFPNEQIVPTAQIYNQPQLQSPQIQHVPQIQQYSQQQYQTPSSHKQTQLQNIEQEFVQQALQAQKLQEQFQHNPQPPVQLQQSYRGQYLQETVTKPSTTAAPAPKKRKPHQPPLAVYMGTEGQEEIKIGDVLALLKDAKTISVQDSVGPDSPQIFVGPSHLEAPDGYVKFDLPYLSSIEGNRIERKVDQLPFFVAPLSYKTPPGYSKIPFPAPHVGSVVVNHLKATSKEPTSTESSRFLPTQNQEDKINDNNEGTTTVRTRTRQRLPSRGSYSTNQPPISSDIPYGPLPSKSSSESHSTQDVNPYGPTQYIQATTPTIYDKTALPEQLFQTKNRFSTVSSNKNQYLPLSTESNVPTTLAAGLSNDKYTVLEEFVANKQIHEGVRFRPTQETYSEESSEKTALPLISNTQSAKVQYVSTQEAPVKHRIVENYSNIQAEQPVTPSTHTYEIPSQHPRIRQQYIPEYIEQPTVSTQHSKVQEVKTQPTRIRGKQHFTPDSYFEEEYQQHKESVHSSTKQPSVEYKTPQYLNADTYYSTIAQEHSDDIQKQEYVLPAHLPPISPQLPGLVNSLQDQALRPLLAPLLIPAPEQTPVSSTESSEEYYPSSYSSPEPLPTTTTTTTTTTPVPIETTTQFKRTRTRQRGTRPTVSYDYVSTTPSSRRQPAAVNTNYRNRRPVYSTQTRQEIQRTKENYPTSTVNTDVIGDSSTRATFTRNRVISRDRQYVSSSTTEQPRRTPAPTSPPRQRFRTRGRPIKSEEDYVERSTPQNIAVYKQSNLEGGFETIVPVHYNNDESHRSTLVPKVQKEQALIYIENKPTLQESSPTHVTPEYIPRQGYISSTESVQPIYHSTIGASAPENNIVHDQPNPSINPIINYSPTESNIQPQVEYHSNQESTHHKYKTEPDSKEQSTTEYVRAKTRSRVKTRPRVSTSTVPASKYQSSSTPATIYRSSTEGKNSEEEEEFYGFFRAPNFQKPVQIEYKQESEPAQRLTPTVAYIRQPTEEISQRPVYSTPKSYSPVTHIDDSYVNPNIQYVSSTLSPSSVSISSAEESDEIQPVTRRPLTTTYSRSRRPNIPVRSDQIPEKQYTRTTKRPEVTRTRGRIRKPVRLSTVRPTAESDIAYSNSPRTNELDNHSEEYREVTKSRVINRGKAHFHNPRVESSVESDESEGENYPAAFLQGHGLQHHRNQVSSTTPTVSTHRPTISSESVTPRGSFQLTIEPEDSRESYDQIPNYSVHKPKVATKDLEDGVEESILSAKFIEKPQSFNYITSDEKNQASLIAEQSDSTSVSSTTDEVTTESLQEETTIYSEQPTTDNPITTTEEGVEVTKPNSRRRGVWKLKKVRPVFEEFESAETQNVGTVFNNQFDTNDKPVKKYNSFYILKSTEAMNIETTTLPVIETTTLTEKVPSTTEASLLAPLYEMFGFSSSDNEEKNPTQSTDQPRDQTTESSSNDQESTTIPPTTSNINTTTQLPEILTTTTEDVPATPRIIGTSTTTEISHETEICYRGKCIKSTSTENIDRI